MLISSIRWNRGGRKIMQLRMARPPRNHPQRKMHQHQHERQRTMEASRIEAYISRHRRHRMRRQRKARNDCRPRPPPPSHPSSAPLTSIVRTNMLSYHLLFNYTTRMNTNVSYIARRHICGAMRWSGGECARVAVRVRGSASICAPSIAAAVRSSFAMRRRVIARLNSCSDHVGADRRSCCPCV
jgi:hypothetical protein